MRTLGRLAGGFYLVLLYLFVAGPLLFVIATSFNPATSFPAQFEGLTLSWYAAILKRPEFLTATWTSALVAALAAALAVVVSFLAAYALSRKGGPGGNGAMATLLASPLLVPQVVISLAILQLASAWGVGTGFWGLVAAHAVYVMPFALRLILTGLARFDFAVEEASRSLGGSPLATWREVTLPLLRPSIVAGFTFCFILSFVNLPLSLFLTGPDTATLPIVMFAYIESRIDPMIAAVASLIVLAAGTATILLDRFLHVRLVD
ncbi:ABC transporter permease [Roseomonas marmotae]|uniref:ABC transporter permease n=1 Tax=Roseomonas marmotae TaxID=2768161 RepID=A0ABS3KAU8_9PROT|nr:ABC transporter permease [Roseomonas marmotae]MBO1074594.1 ABC transporter permease [Roseomonas marmotae]QTI81621.1 ABC transporter permease [Roseomonas marmotae]